jgi:hypothetical protein
VSCHRRTSRRRTAFGTGTLHWSPATYCMTGAGLEAINSENSTRVRSFTVPFPRILEQQRRSMFTKDRQYAPSVAALVPHENKLRLAKPFLLTPARPARPAARASQRPLNSSRYRVISAKQLARRACVLFLLTSAYIAKKPRERLLRWLKWASR